MGDWMDDYEFDELKVKVERPSIFAPYLNPTNRELKGNSVSSNRSNRLW